MSAAILKWLGGPGTGSSSKALALTAMGQMPTDAKHSYPRDGADFGRCLRLIEAAPEAKTGLDKLATDGGPYWKALSEGWDDIEAAYRADMAAEPKGRACYDLMRSILQPIEAGDRGIIRLGPGVTMRVA